MFEKQRECARQSIDVLSQTFGLRPEVKVLYQKGEIPLSCAVQYVGGVLNSLKNVPKYEKIVRKFEEEFSAHVYCCMPGGCFVTMLYVSADEREWESMKPRLGEKVVFAAVYNCTYNCFDFGEVVLSEKNGVLIRVG